MSHIKYRNKTRAEATDSAWLPIGMQVGALTNQWAGRYDIVAYVGPGAGGGVAPACFTPSTAEVEVDVNIAFNGVNPDQIGDLTKRATQYEWPKAVGAIFHEALHAKYSLWDIEQACKDLTQEEFRALTYLEESRIEHLGLREVPGNKGFLRAAAIELVLGDLKSDPLETGGSRMAAACAALTMARVDAGSLEADDIASIADIIEAKLGLDIVSKLRDIWLEAQEYTLHTNAAGMYDLARRWVAAVQEAADRNGEPEQDPNGDPGGSGSGSGGSIIDQETRELVEEMVEALEEAGENAAIGAQDDLDEQRTTEEWQEVVKERSSSAKTQKEHEKVSDEVFGKGTGPMADAHTSSRLVEERMPTGPERSAAVTIARLLEKAKYRERDEIEIKSVLPPGRLRTRAVVQGAALKSKGVMTQAEPWRRTMRKHTDDPTLNIGVMVDISGSMAWAMEPMGATAWILSEAVRRVQGRSSMVYYGEGVFATLKPGQHLNKVTIYSAPDGTEKFDKAFKTLNGGLNLLGGTGARMVVVISDGCYTYQESERARHWVTQCGLNGVGVLWLSMGTARDAGRIVSGTQAQLVEMPAGTETPDIAKRIGEAAARALSSVGRG
ncbi:cobalamin biosynthesis protein [Actinomycetia phage DSL-LC01]|nr:cobalamin biosynthesis protein [Actinomycetia phage DSL-LC01]